jgi:hypothetical protein
MEDVIRPSSRDYPLLRYAELPSWQYPAAENHLGRFSDDRARRMQADHSPNAAARVSATRRHALVGAPRLAPYWAATL